jgi:hypothetical protein
VLDLDAVTAIIADVADADPTARELAARASPCFTRADSDGDHHEARDRADRMIRPHRQRRLIRPHGMAGAERRVSRRRAVIVRAHECASWRRRSSSLVCTPSSATETVVR